jgi:signal transduction histidine kinase
MGDNREIETNISKASMENSIENSSKFDFSTKSFIRLLPIGMIIFDHDLRIIEANSHAKEIIKVNTYIDKSLAKGTDNKIWQSWTKLLREVISTGKALRFDEVEYTTDNNTKLLRITCTSFRQGEIPKDNNGIVIIEDVTEKVDFQTHITNTERLAAVGKLASRVAHELNNPLDGILRYINLTLRAIEQENLEKPKEYLTQCRQGLMRMIQIVKELLEFSRSTYTPQELVSIEQTIEDALRTMDLKAETLNIKIQRNYKSGLPKIRCGSLFQVFCNLAKNAIDAMPNGGQLEISTALDNNNRIIVEFRDSGSGLPSENIESIFEPFFTTKEQGKGTGLGLAICRDIVKRYQGTITARNAPEGGSIFNIYLPVPGNP